jgi:peptidoglycan hydrolase CwlO-like protein
LEVEKRANAELWLIVNTQHVQMDDLLRQVKETKASRIREQEEMKKQQTEMKKLQTEMNAKLEFLFSQGRAG